MLFNDSLISLGTPVKTDDKTYRWPLSTKLYVFAEPTGWITNTINCVFSRVFPKFDDTLVLKVAKGKRISCLPRARKDKPKLFTLTHEDIAIKFEGLEPGQSEYRNM